MARYGEYNADGSVKTQADECILTGRELFPPFDTTIRERVTGTPFFYRVLGSQYHRVTEEMRAGWVSEVKRAEKTAYSGRRGSEKVEASE